MQVVDEDDQLFAKDFWAEDPSRSFIDVFLDIGLEVFAGGSAWKIDVQFHEIFRVETVEVIRDDDWLCGSGLSDEHDWEFVADHEIKQVAEFFGIDCGH